MYLGGFVELQRTTNATWGRGSRPPWSLSPVEVGPDDIVFPALFDPSPESRRQLQGYTFLPGDIVILGGATELRRIVTG